MTTPKLPDEIVSRPTPVKIYGPIKVSTPKENK